ncbi:MAG: hypothetical protein ACHQYQ_00280 [Bacteriovoracales bacterium]
MKKILINCMLLFSLPIFATDFCILLTKKDPFLTAKQDCTHVPGGANNVGIKLTVDQLAFLKNSGFDIIAVANSASGTLFTFKKEKTTFY